MDQIKQGNGQLLETILDHTHMLVAYMDPQFNFVRVNRTYAQADNREPGFFPGKNHFELYPNPENQQIFEHVLETGTPYFVHAKPFEYAENPERGVSYWDWSLVPTKDGSGVITGLVLTLVDVSDQIRTHLMLADRTDELQKRVKELNCLYDISALIEQSGIALEAILKGVADLIPTGMHNPDVACARILLDDREFTSGNFRPTDWRQASNLIVNGERSGRVEVYYMKEIPERDNGPFMQEEKSLIHAIAGRLGKTIGRIRGDQSRLESEKLLRTIAANYPAYLSIIQRIGEDLIVDFTSGKEFNRLGLEPGKFIGLSLEDVFGEFSPIVREHYLKVFKGEEVSFELFINDQYQRYNVVPIYQEDGEIRQILSVVENITERKRAEQALLESKFELEQRVQERTAGLLAANQALKNEIEERQQAEAQLKLQTLAMNSAANGIVITDRNANIEWANPAFSEMSGYAPEEVLGQNIRLLNSGQHSPEFFIQLWATILSGQVWRGETINRRKNGSLYIEEQTITPVLDSVGEIMHFIAIKHDISERKKAQQALENERQRLYTLLNELPAIVYLKDQDYKIRFANRRFLDQFGDPQGHLCYQVVRGQNEPCEDCSTQAVLKDRLPHRWEWTLPNKRVYQLYDYPFIDVDGSQLVLQLGIDVTEQKHAEAELKRSNRELLALSQIERSQRHFTEGLLHANLALSASLNLDEVLERILAQLQRVIPYTGAAVLMVEDDTLKLVRQRGLGNSPLVQAARTSGVPLDQHGSLKEILNTGKIIFAPHISGLPDYKPMAGLEWIESLFFAPLVSGEQVVGLIVLLSNQIDFFNQEMVTAVEAFSAQAMVAFNNARLYQGEMKMRRTAEILEASSQALAQTLDLETMLETLLDFIKKLVPYDSATIFLLDEDGRLRTKASRDYQDQSGGDLLGYTFDIYEFPAYRSLVEDIQPTLIEDVRARPDWKDLPGLERVRNWIGTPLLAGGEVIGACCICKNEVRHFTQEHLHWTEVLVGQASMSVQNALLFAQVRESSVRMQALSHRLVEVQENERRYVARELHDEAGQALTSLKVGLELLERTRDRPETVQKGITELKQTVDRVMENLHRLAMDLRPASLDHLGLLAALRQDIQIIRQKRGLEIQLETVGISERLPAELETTLYRIAQEALTNILRHAQATQVGILLEQRGDKIVLIIEDNGVGFDPSSILINGHLGIFGMRERAEMLGADLIIESSEGMGSTIYVEVPYGDAHPVGR